MDMFMTLQKDDDDGSWARHLEEKLDVIPYRAGYRAAGQTSPDLAPSIVGSLPGSPIFPVEVLEFDGERKARPVPVPLPSQTSTTLPTSSILSMSCQRLFRSQ